MGGRGRGRGRGVSINIEALGLGRGEILPPIAQPPPLFPPLQCRPVSLVWGEDMDYMLSLKQELRKSFFKSGFHVKAPNKVKDIERYSDIYQAGAGDATSATLTPDWSRLPFELQYKRKRKAVSNVKPVLKSARRVQDSDVSSLLEKLEEGDIKLEAVEDADAQEEENEEKTEKEEDGENEEEEYEEEELEEETDYNLAYFDNGEGYGDDDEEDDEGPTY